MEESPLAILLFINSILLIALILTQNQIGKDSGKQQTQISSTTWLEKFTWTLVFSQFVLLLLNVKNSVS